MRPVPIAAGCLAAALAVPAAAQIAVSANDHKVRLVNGVNTVVAQRDTRHRHDHRPQDLPADRDRRGQRADERRRPAALGRDHARRVAGARHLGDEDRTRPTRAKTVPDNRMSVIDLTARPPKVLGVLEAGMGAAGVAINRAGNLALVADRSAGTVSVFTIAGKTVTPAGRVDFGAPQSGPSGIAITPDGRTALVTRDGDHKISVLAIDGTNVTYTKRDLNAGPAALRHRHLRARRHRGGREHRQSARATPTRSASSI